MSDIDYLDGLMRILIKSPQLPSALRRQITALLKTKEENDKAKEDDGSMTIPIKMSSIFDNMDLGEEE